MGTKIDGGGQPLPIARTNTAAPAAPASAPAAPEAAKGWSPTVKVDGADRRTQMRMGDDPASLQAQNQMPIACPVLKALVADGSVHVDPSGRVQTSELLDALKAHGMTAPMLEAIRGITYFANDAKDIPRNAATQSFDIMHLRSGLTMHDSDSNILSQGHFDQQAFDRFTSHAKNGWMDEQAFADAIRSNTEGDMKAQNPLVALTFGQNAVLAEYPVLMKLFNTTGPDGKPAIKVDDLQALFKDGKLPSNAAAGSVGMLNSTAAYATMLAKVEPKLAGDVFRSPQTATGMALKGAQLSSDPSAAAASGATAAAGKGAAAAAKCPFMNGAAAMPNPVQQAVDVHTQ